MQFTNSSFSLLSNQRSFSNSINIILSHLNLKILRLVVNTTEKCDPGLYIYTAERHLQTHILVYNIRLDNIMLHKTRF